MATNHNRKRKFKIYFFNPAFRPSDQEKIESSLQKIKKAYREIGIKKINASGRIKQERLFKEYFDNPKTSQLIRRRVGSSPRQLFKLSKSGNSLYLRGVVALSEDNLVQWANKAPQCFELLEDIVSRGPDAIKDLYTFSEHIKNEEVDLLDIFESSEYCEGNLERSVWIPTSNSESSFYNQTSKWIDALLKKPNGHYIIIEAEIELNYTAIGQALCYERWFQAHKNIYLTQPAIICKNYKKEFLFVCKKLGITVFCISDNEVKKI